MSKVSLRDRMRAQMKKRVQESYERNDDKGTYTSIFKTGMKNVSFWKCPVSKDEHILDIIPYAVGQNDPLVVKGHMNAGDFAYVLDLWVHKNIGVNNGSYVCPARNYNKPCPICEAIKEIRKNEDYDEDELKKIQPKRRAIYNVLCYDSEKEEEKGIQVWEVAHWFSERFLAPLAKSPRGGGFVPFADPVEGKSVVFTRQALTDFIGYKFLDRDYEIPDEILEQAHCLDELLTIPMYEQLKDVYFGGSTKIETEDSALTEPISEKDAVEMEKAEQKPSAPTQLAPAGRTRPRPTRTRPMRAAKPASECPEGGVFGKDIESFDHCNVCDKWHDCAKLADEMEENDIPF